MKIVVNTRFLIHDQLEGIGVFSKNVLERITRSHPEHEFIFLFDRDFHSSFIFNNNVRGIKLFPPARHPFLWYLWFEYAVASFLQKEKPDLFISMDGYLPLKAKCKTALVIHDLSFEHYPKDIPWLASKYYRYYTPLFAKKANKILTVSEFSKKDISDKYQVNLNKIHVVYNGADDVFQPLSEIKKNQIREQLTQGAAYFIYVGSVHQRKNIPNLLRAFEKFKKETYCDAKLVIAGRSFWNDGNLDSILHSMNYRADVIFTGRISTEKLAEYLGAALALTYVSYFEGFGIPVLEAMNCDVPVITSNVSSMPEVAGNAALLVDPFSPDEISNAMNSVYTSCSLREELILRGRIQRDKFSWDKTAALFWKEVLGFGY